MTCKCNSAGFSEAPWMARISLPNINVSALASNPNLTWLARTAVAAGLGLLPTEVRNILPFLLASQPAALLRALRRH